MNKAPIENTVPKLHQQISNNLDTGNLLNIGALESYFNDVHNDFVNWFLVETTDESLKFMYFDKDTGGQNSKYQQRIILAGTSSWY